MGQVRLLQNGDGAEPAATLLEQRVMTPEYASPEHLRGEPVTTASNVYSLGVVLYRLLTGQLPHRLKAQSAEEMARALGQTEQQRPSAVAAAASGRRLRASVVYGMCGDAEFDPETSDLVLGPINRRAGSMPAPSS